jgi:hypothetical protein
MLIYSICVRNVIMEFRKYPNTIRNVLSAKVLAHSQGSG